MGYWKIKISKTGNWEGDISNGSFHKSSESLLERSFQKTKHSHNLFRHF